MFQRAFRVKSNTATKGSDKKKLKRTVSALFPHLAPSQLNLLLPSSGKVAMTTSKLATHSGSDVTVYCIERDPLFFEEGARVFPTVYAVWLVPEILRCVTTWPRVLPKLQGGADLMLPGVVTERSGGTAVEGIVKGECCAVNLVGNRSAVGVCIALMSHDQMLANQMRGKGFRILHVYGDYLWEMGSKLHPPLHVVSMQPSVDKLTNLSAASEPSTSIGTDADTDSEVKTKGTTLEQQHHISDPQDFLSLRRLEDLVPVGSSQVSGCIDPGPPCARTKVQEEGSDSHEDPHRGQSLIGEREVEDDPRNKREVDVVDGRGSYGESVELERGRGTGKEQEEEESGDLAMELLQTDLTDMTEAVDLRGSGKEEEEKGAMVSNQPINLVAPENPVGGEKGNESEESDPTRVMDELLQECFLEALVKRVKQSDLPILTSTFYKAHMMAVCPPSQRLDVKKSSYKKLSLFLKAMASDGVITVKELSKGVESITATDPKHLLVKGFVPRLLGDGLLRATPTGGATLSSTANPLRITELFMPSHKLLRVFSTSGHTKLSTLDQREVREVITGYVKENELVSPSNPRFVIMDPILSDALHRRGEPFPEYLPWPELMQRVLDEMRPAFRVMDTTGGMVIRKGKLQPIRLTVAQRTGNKKVTLVDNLTAYGIPPLQLARTMQRVAAASSTVSECAGRADSQQVLVQGNAVKTLARVLQENYGVPLKFIEAIDRVKPQKKKTTKR